MKVINFLIIFFIFVMINACGKDGGSSAGIQQQNTQSGNQQSHCQLPLSGNESVSELLIAGLRANECGLTEIQLLGLVP